MNARELSQVLASTVGVEYDCRRCGACCLASTPRPGYVVLSGGESARMRALGLPVVSDPVQGECLGTEPYDGPGGAAACAAFLGAPGFPCSCSIYADRPARCRDFEAGSAACRLARLRAGLPL